MTNLDFMIKNLQKYSELILSCIEYGADKSDKKITKTKLAKLAYLVDFAKYYDTLEPVSNLTYKKIDRGPVPNEYFEIIDELYENGFIKIEEKTSHGTPMFLISLTSKKFKKKHLSTEELSYVEKICAKWIGKNTAEIVNFTHDQIPWKISFMRDDIPYSLITQENPANVF